MSGRPLKSSVVKETFNADAVDNTLRSLARMLARQAAECDYREHIKNTKILDKEGP